MSKGAAFAFDCGTPLQRATANARLPMSHEQAPVSTGKTQGNLNGGGQERKQRLFFGRVIP
jgi:hypothetical protein